MKQYILSERLSVPMSEVSFDDLLTDTTDELEPVFHSQPDMSKLEKIKAEETKLYDKRGKKIVLITYLLPIAAFLCYLGNNYAEDASITNFATLLFAVAALIGLTILNDTGNLGKLKKEREQTENHISQLSAPKPVIPSPMPEGPSQSNRSFRHFYSLNNPKVNAIEDQITASFLSSLASVNRDWTRKEIGTFFQICFNGCTVSTPWKRFVFTDPVWNIAPLSSQADISGFLCALAFHVVQKAGIRLNWRDPKLLTNITFYISIDRMEEEVQDKESDIIDLSNSCSFQCNITYSCINRLYNPPTRLK